MLFFDGVCNLCDGFVNLVADNDSEQRVIFGAIQKHQELLASLGAGKYAEGGSEALTTMILIQGDQVHVRSTAALRTLALLDQPWRSFSIFLLLPAPIRDFAYSIVGANRYRLFGQVDSCRAPTPRFEERFIEHQATSSSPFRT